MFDDPNAPCTSPEADDNEHCWDAYGTCINLECTAFDEDRAWWGPANDDRE
jgi:hypothetical protein